jgi:hypothetical protein
MRHLPYFKGQYAMLQSYDTPGQTAEKPPP